MDFVRAVSLALLLHAIVLALLVIQLGGGEGSPAPVIQAKVVRQLSSAPEPTEARPNKTRPQRARRRAEHERKQARARQQAAAEKVRELEAKRKAEAEAKRKAEAEAKRKAEAEAKRKAEAKRQRQRQFEQRAQKQLQQQLAAEEAQRVADAERARAAKEADEFESKIFARVSRNWILSANVDRGLQCTVLVHLAPGGDVLTVNIVTPSGNPNFDRSVENAVYKSSPLPVPTDAAAFEQLRELELTFSPKDIQR